METSQRPSSLRIARLRTHSATRTRPGSSRCIVRSPRGCERHHPTSTCSSSRRLRRTCAGRSACGSRTRPAIWRRLALRSRRSPSCRAIRTCSRSSRVRSRSPASARALRDEARTAGERLGRPRRAAHSTKQPAPVAPPRTILELARTGELWTVRGFGETVHVKSSRGLEMLAKLVAVPHQPLHALELAGARDPVDGGDAGPQLDAQAKAEYRARLRELVGDRDAAEAANDAGRLARIQHELEALTSELERAVGLGGRDRKAGAASERARSNVQRRIAHAIDQICAGSARLGEHLAATIETGTYCCYRPAPAA